MGCKVILIVALVLSGCTVASVTISADPTKIWCDTNAPRHPTVEQVQTMTRSQLDELNAHNMKGAAWCGWTP